MGPAAAAFYKKGHGEGPTTSTRNDDGQRGSAVHSAAVRRDGSTRIRTDAAEDSCSQNRLTRIGAPRRPAAGRLQEENQGRWGVNLVSARRPRMGGTDVPGQEKRDDVPAGAGSEFALPPGPGLRRTPTCATQATASKAELSAVALTNLPGKAVCQPPMRVSQPGL